MTLATRHTNVYPIFIFRDLQYIESYGDVIMIYMYVFFTFRVAVTATPRQTFECLPSLRLA